MDSQEGTSGLKESYLEISIEAGVIDNQGNTSGAVRAQGIATEEFCRKMTSKLRTKLVEKQNSKSPEAKYRKEVTIFRASLNIGESKTSLFEPSVVSIGPYHRGHSHLRAMEEKKWSFLQDFLLHGEYTLEHCIRKVAALAISARCCYNVPFDMSNEEFVEMMVLDGCFIVEFFYKYFIKRDLRVISERWILSIIEKDLILLDNQIPFFIIKALESFLGTSQIDLDNIVLLLTRQLIPIRKNLPEEKNICHLLHLCHCYALSDPERMSSHSTKNSEQNFPTFLNWIWAVPILRNFFLEKEEKLGEDVLDKWRLGMTIPCATDLEEAGVKLKRANKTNELTKIAFKSGTLEIPPLHIDNGLKPLLMNLVSLEQCMPLHLPSHFSTYIVFMDKLVNTPHDVKLLQQKGILHNTLSSEEEMTEFFNQTGQSLHIPDDHYLAQLFKRVNEYCEKRYHRHWARLLRDYFNSPWSMIALTAASVLLFLTIIQTLMSVISYIYPPKQ